MALTDLADLDLIDLILGHRLSEEKKEELLKTYQEAYTVALGNAVSRDLTAEDSDEMAKIMAKPDLQPEEIEKFYTDRIPHFAAKITLLALEFKKKFVISVYQNKIEEYKNSDNKQGLAAWEQVLMDAQQDNWNEVSRILRVIDGMGSLTSPAPTAIAAK